MTIDNQLDRQSEGKGKHMSDLPGSSESTTADEPQSRSGTNASPWRFQYSLRILLILIALMSVAGWYIRQVTTVERDTLLNLCG